MCSGFEQDLVASLSDDAFTNGAGDCSSLPSHIKAGNSDVWKCDVNDEVVIYFTATKWVTMVKANGDWEYANKFQLFSSMDGLEFNKIAFDTHDVSIIHSCCFFWLHLFQSHSWFIYDLKNKKKQNKTYHSYTLFYMKILFIEL